METRSGGIGLGFRYIGARWSEDMRQCIAWAAANDIEVLDIRAEDIVHARAILDAGLRVGTIDFPACQQLITQDRAQREQALVAARDHIRNCTEAFGPGVILFTLMLPTDPKARRADNFAAMGEAYQALTPCLIEHDCHLSIEGWPGPGALCCNPETYRAFFKALPDEHYGINYDPSHLVRMGIDPIRFLIEFKDRIKHVHAKDTYIDRELLYEIGHEQDPVFTDPLPWGGNYWRYALPGHGDVNWLDVCGRLARDHYRGAITIELEDYRFIDDMESQQHGIRESCDFLSTC